MAVAEIIAAFSTAMSPRYLFVVVFIAAGIAMINKVSPRLALYVPASLFLAQAVATVLKYTIQRPRQPIEAKLVYTHDPTFTSGHTSATLAIAFALIFL